MNRQQELLKLCSKSNRLKITDSLWSYRIQKDDSPYEVFNIPKYSLENNGKVNLIHENYKRKTSKRAGAKTPCHSHEGFNNVSDLVRYILSHRTRYGVIIKKSKGGRDKC